MLISSTGYINLFSVTLMALVTKEAVLCPYENLLSERKIKALYFFMSLRQRNQQLHCELNHTLVLTTKHS